MFTGIIETKGKVETILKQGNNMSLWVSSKMSKELKPNQSVAHNGVCLTIEEIKKEGSQYWHKVTLVKESLDKTNFKFLKLKQYLNLERCLKLSDRLDGHFVQGHVDSTATLIKKEAQKGSTLFIFKLPLKKFKKLFVEKGSITINGISLTCFNVTDSTFTVAIIPHTIDLTNIDRLVPTDLVNIEFDILGKYILR